jgi:putative acetyltransferase
MLPVRLARVGIDDWAAVRYVHARAFERLAAPYLEPDEVLMFNNRVAAPEYTEDLMGENLVGAWIEQELTGTAGWRPADDHGRTARITAVFVNPMFARLGIGSRLLRDAEARAEVAGYKSFSVRATPNAVGFFTLHGYDISSHGLSMIAPDAEVPVTFMRKSLALSG